jgi:putative ABC transport system permease protein
MPNLALKNLVHDKVRLAVTLVGIIFSVVLSAVQLGLFVGFMHATADIIVNSKADIWISSKSLANLENGIPFSESKYFQVKAVEGVERVTKQIVQFGIWKKPDGGDEGVMIVGFEPDGEMGEPWNLTQGKIDDLRQPDSVIIDELYAEKLGISHISQTVEIRGHKAKVVGFTRGIRTFTTSPAVFCSFKNAQNYFGLAENKTLYILVKAKQGVDLQQLKSRLQTAITDVDVRTNDEFTVKQQYYWMFGTGAGITVLIAAGLGLLVGVVIVAQTIYSATVDHLKEYGTLKAIGASNFYLYRVIITQATISGIVGYAIGMSIALFVSAKSLEGTTAIILPWQLVAALFVLVMGMCIFASMISINKVMRIDPAMVFKG